MRKRAYFIVLLLLLCLGVSAAICKGLDLNLVSKFSSVNIFEGNEFNNYPMSYFDISVKMDYDESGEISVSPYYAFNSDHDYYEWGINSVFKMENEKAGIKLSPFYVNWSREGQTNRGFVFWGEVTIKTSILDLKAGYMSSHVIKRTDLNGNLYRFTLSKSIISKSGMVEIDANMIFNSGFFEDRPGRFIYTAGLAIKDISFLLPIVTEIFVVYAYSTDVTNKVMVGVKVSGIKESHYRTHFKSLVDRVARKKGGLPSIEIGQASAKAWSERPVEMKKIGINTAAVKGLFVWLFKFWLFGCVFSSLLYAYRCQIRGTSFKEIVLIHPFSLMCHSVFWIVGLLVNYPEGRMGIAYRFHNMRMSYMHRKGSDALTDKEEQMLWEQAAGPVIMFNTGITRVFQYSRAIALASTLIIWLVSPIQKGLAATEEKKEVAPITKFVKGLEFSGYMQFRWEYSEEGNNFTIPLIVMNLKSQLSRILKWQFEFDFSEKKLRDAWIQMAIDDWIKIRAGKWFASYIVTPNPSHWYLVEYPKAMALATIYAVGVRLEGEIKLIKYYLGVINGNGSQLEDDNREKDIYAHLQLSPFEWLSVGAVLQRGEQPEGMRTKYKGHLKLDLRDIHAIVLSEYFAEETEGSARKFGWYLIAAWNPWKKIGFACQYDFLDDGEAVKKNFTLGVNVFLINGFKIQLNYELGLENLGNRVLARIQVRF